MTDERSTLTPEQWRMARQAGAAFTDEDVTAVQTPFGQQLMLPGVGPQLGDTYRNKHTGTIGTLVLIRQGRYAWYTLRRDGRNTDMTGRQLEEHWVRCRPDGRPR